MRPITSDRLMHQVVGKQVICFEIGDGTDFRQPILYGVSMHVQLIRGAFHIAVRVQVVNKERFQQELAVAVCQQRF